MKFLETNVTYGWTIERQLVYAAHQACRGKAQSYIEDKILRKVKIKLHHLIVGYIAYYQYSLLSGTFFSPLDMRSTISGFAVILYYTIILYYCNFALT